ncbi:unnamed protein product [Meganyctiphanes norvegica]|uniref:Carbohydrate sulfotransferase n=1 Tax=Meganyctiphanes norvegica TaxID=48144 RepID=A0AAV2QWU1_MEGNR
MIRYLRKYIKSILLITLLLYYSNILIEIQDLSMLNKKYFSVNKTEDFMRESSDLDSNISNKSSDFMLEQKRRQSFMHATCKKIRSEGSHPLLFNTSALIDIFIDRRHNLTFCPVYKAASTSWFIILLQLNGMWKEGNLPRLLDIVKEIFPKIEQFEDPLLSQSKNRFIIVRHPFERLLSCYRDKYEGAKNNYFYDLYGEKIISSYRNIPEIQEKYKTRLLHAAKVYTKSKDFKNAKELPKSLKHNPYSSPFGPTFPEFVRFVLESPDEDNHWKPMYKLCSLCKIDFNIILKFENIYSESLSFINYLNYSSILDPRWDNPTNGGHTRSNQTCDYIKQLSIDTVKGLIEKYSNDLLLFQYSPDKYLECAEK